MVVRRHLSHLQIRLMKTKKPQTTPIDSIGEFIGNRRVTGLRWNNGVLEMRVAEDYQRHENHFIICSGTREIWDVVPNGDEPAS
jgi:hypothetical protein